VLAGEDGGGDIGDAALGGLGVEVNGVLRVGEGGGEIGGPAGDSVGGGEGVELVLIAADEDGIGHESGAVWQGDAALIADGHDGAHEC